MANPMEPIRLWYK